jgi:hypothetical protein
MKKALLAVAALSCMGSAALAGPNAGGTLIAALSVGTVYCTDTATYCGSTTTTACEAAVTTHAGGTTAVINIIAAFPGVGDLAGLTWGVTYTPGVFIVGFGNCGEFELPDSNWPDSGSGNAVTWGTGQNAQLVEVYWFAAYNYYGGCEGLQLTGHPTQGAFFGDDDVPSNSDPIAGLGLFGFNCPGNAPCPDAGNPLGACCFPDGSCQVLFEQDCIAAGGQWQGPDTICETADCPQPLTGACCIGEDCSIQTRAGCEGNGGVYQGDGTVCDPNPCIIVPTIEASWGEIKNNYR